jgi:hypothetical protein
MSRLSGGWTSRSGSSTAKERVSQNRHSEELLWGTSPTGFLGFFTMSSRTLVPDI